MSVQQINFSFRVRVAQTDWDRTSAFITKREVKAILKAAFKGAVRKGARDVTVFDGGHCIAHWDGDPYSEGSQTINEAFAKPLGK